MLTSESSGTKNDTVSLRSKRDSEMVFQCLLCVKKTMLTSESCGPKNGSEMVFQRLLLVLMTAAAAARLDPTRQSLH